MLTRITRGRAANVWRDWGFSHGDQASLVLKGAEAQLEADKEKVGEMVQEVRQQALKDMGEWLDCLPFLHRDSQKYYQILLGEIEALKRGEVPREEK